MIYRFDILFRKFRKNVNGGGIKVFTFSKILENPDVFGQGEGLAGAEGELSMVLDGPEAGFSINALYRKYHSQLVGRKNVEMFGKDFPMRFVFTRSDNPSSIRIEMRDEDGNTYSSDVHTEDVHGSRRLDRTGVDSFQILIVREGECTVTDEMNAVTSLQPGQIAFCPVTAKEVTVHSDHAVLISASTMRASSL